MTCRLLLAAAVLALAACSSETPKGPESETGSETEAAAPVERGGAPGRAFAYTKLSECKTVREETEEGQFLEQDCPGIGGYALKSTVGDLRANLEVIGAGGKGTSLDLSRIGGGGFSAVGETLEWRGPAGDPLAPDALIVRYNVVEQPETNEEVSYLLVTKLGDTPCVVAKVPPGPGQNARARDLADQGGTCIAG
ncbi:hypothetical protein [Tsuneonella sp. HG222]